MSRLLDVRKIWTIDAVIENVIGLVLKKFELKLLKFIVILISPQKLKPFQRLNIVFLSYYADVFHIVTYQFVFLMFKPAGSNIFRFVNRY